MVKINNGSYIIGFDDGYQLGKTANFIFDNGIHRLGCMEPTLKENFLFYNSDENYTGEYLITPVYVKVEVSVSNHRITDIVSSKCILKAVENAIEN